MGKYQSYDKTNKFYIALGFKEFEIFPTLWDEWNSCQIYVAIIFSSNNPLFIMPLHIFDKDSNHPTMLEIFQIP